MSSLTGTMAGRMWPPAAGLRVVRETVRLPAWVPYLLRVSAAATIALYLAFALQLPTPYSALTTVYIVANPVRGAIVSKSIWRIVGTLIGAVMAIVQTALLAQSPLLFDLFIAVWMGLCCGLASLLRFFTSYGAVLAGYTVVIVDVGVFAHPENALATALYRMSVVVIGIVVCGMVFLLTQRGTAPEAFETATGHLLADVANLIRRALAERPNEALRTERRLLAGRITALEQDIVYAGSDNIAVRARAVALRVAGTRLLGALTSGFHAAERLGGFHAAERLGGFHAAERLGGFHAGERLGGVHAGDRPGEAGSVGALFDAALERASASALTDRAAAAAAIEHATAAFAARRGEAAHLQAGDLDTLGAEEQARDTLERLGRALALLGERGRQRLPRLVPFLDWSGALRNGVRGFLVVAIACLGWYVTAGPAAPTLLAYLVPAAALLSTTPSPGMAAARFAQGSTIGTVMAVLVQAFILPQVTGFPLLMVVLLVTAAPGIALQPNVTWGGAAFAYLVFMNTQIAVTNPMQFGLTGILENAEMYLLGNVALILVFRILLPPDPARAARNLARSLAASASRLARRRFLPEPLTWENTQLQKILRYGQRLDQMKTTRRSALIAEATAALILGRIVLQLRLLVGSRTLPATVAAAAEAGLRNLHHLRHAPLVRAAAVERNAVLVASEAAGMTAGNGDDAPRGDDLRAPGPARGEVLRVAALLHEAARLVGEHAAYFDRNTTVAGIGA